MAKITTVLIDLDGTIRDTVDAIYEAIEHSFRELGETAPSREEMYPYAHYHDHIRAQFLPDVTREAFEEFYIKHGDEAVLHAPLYEGIEEMLHELKQREYKLAIVSSGGDIAGYLKLAGLEDVFDVIVGGHDVVNKKPHPEPVETALERLGMRPDEAVMIGDLPADIQSANAAGVQRTIGVTYGMGSQESLEQAGATYIVNAAREIIAAIEREDTV